MTNFISYLGYLMFEAGVDPEDPIMQRNYIVIARDNLRLGKPDKYNHALRIEGALFQEQHTKMFEHLW